MRVIVIGAGVVGAATAYFLARSGHEVTVLDRQGQPGQGASFGNAGQLSYSYTDTLADVGMLRRLPGMLLGRDRGMRIQIDLPLLPWGVRFLWRCTRGRADAATVELLHLAARSANALESLLKDAPLDFGYRAAGKLMITGSAQTLAGLQRRADLKRQHGVRVDIVDAKESLAIEPALDAWRSPIAGAAYARNDSAGDAETFTRSLCNHLITHGLARVITGTDVQHLVRHRGRIVGVQTASGLLESDAVVICAGIGARKLVRGLPLCLPIYPLKGYSLTAAPGPRAPTVSLTDLDRRIVFATLAGRVRLAGLADCVGDDDSIDTQRVTELMRLGSEVLPEAAHFDAAQPWAGLRPATPSGLPLVGATRVPGLFLNVGHGALGWTLACGTAQQLAEQLPKRA